MFKINKNRLGLIGCLLVVITAHASTFTIGNKDCSADATYEAISSTGKIQIKGGTYSSKNLYSQKGVVKAHTDKTIEITNPKDKSKVQIIFIHSINNISGKNLTTQLWLTENKLCQVTDKQQCYKSNFNDFYASDKGSSGIQLCMAAYKVNKAELVGLRTVGGSSLKLIK